ncbi:hypothetical protein SAMN05216368_107209 [Cryobacterium flavum]|uniref:Uncharacterized protein n=1 Tax=Cryobacterium flavum TaxID=1424659 RepID=A0A5E9G0T5_9MICO|nr:hypothetical protein SAMN05216368_107209 [Cryobacterium flavum]
MISELISEYLSLPPIWGKYTIYTGAVQVQDGLQLHRCRAASMEAFVDNIFQ